MEKGEIEGTMDERGNSREKVGGGQGMIGGMNDEGAREGLNTEPERDREGGVEFKRERIEWDGWRGGWKGGMGSEVREGEKYSVRGRDEEGRRERENLSPL
ncbi:hypothetical protein J6590_098503 [Homalodisca vitripennis]|nr:hypothetical protein J6590_098503 [Homalodisca vitripennis]